MQIIPILYFLKDNKFFLKPARVQCLHFFSLSQPFPTCNWLTWGRQESLWLEIAGSGTICPGFLHLGLQLALYLWGTPVLWGPPTSSSEPWDRPCLPSIPPLPQAPQITASLFSKPLLYLSLSSPPKYGLFLGRAVDHHPVSFWFSCELLLSFFSSPWVGLFVVGFFRQLMKSFQALSIIFHMTKPVL